jgi:hypothetical protein
MRFTSYTPISLRSNFNFSPTPPCSKLSLPSNVSNKNTVCTSHCPMCYISPHDHLLYPNNVSCDVQIMISSLCNLPASLSGLYFRPNSLLKTLYFFLGVKDEISESYNITGKVTFRELRFSINVLNGNSERNIF